MQPVVLFCPVMRICLLNVTVNGTVEGSDCVGGAVPGSDLHQLLPTALCELRCLRQRLLLQRWAKQPEEDLLLLSAETAAACEGGGGGGESDRHTDNMAERTEGCDLQAADARYTHPSRSNLRGSFVLTCQLHIVADLSGD